MLKKAPSWNSIYYQVPGNPLEPQFSPPGVMIAQGSGLTRHIMGRPGIGTGLLTGFCHNRFLRKQDTDQFPGK